MTCGAYFIGSPSTAEQFLAWCDSGSAGNDTDIQKGVDQLCRHSAFEGSSSATLLSLSAEMMREVTARWRNEHDQLCKEEADLILTGGEKAVAARAVALHKERMTGEYLLRELATQGFLPAYGFPTHIASFDNLTIDRFKREAASRESREDNRYRRRELASRDIPTALREYAPGSEVVMDGLVYKSAGITLNWHVPADKEAAREIQEIRFAWRCQSCGSSGSSFSQIQARTCTHCGSESAKEISGSSWNQQVLQWISTKSPPTTLAPSTLYLLKLRGLMQTATGCHWKTQHLDASGVHLQVTCSTSHAELMAQGMPFVCNAEGRSPWTVMEVLQPYSSSRIGACAAQRTTIPIVRPVMKTGK